MRAKRATARDEAGATQSRRSRGAVDNSQRTEGERASVLVDHSGDYPRRRVN